MALYKDPAATLGCPCNGRIQERCVGSHGGIAHVLLLIVELVLIDALEVLFRLLKCPLALPRSEAVCESPIARALSAPPTHPLSFRDRVRVCRVKFSFVQSRLDVDGQGCTA